jgi:hypothetical protein
MKFFPLKTIFYLLFFLAITCYCETASTNTAKSKEKGLAKSKAFLKTSNLNQLSSEKATLTSKTYFQTNNQFIVNTEFLIDEEKQLLKQYLIIKSDS